MRVVIAAGRAHRQVAGAEGAPLAAHRHGQRALAVAGDDVDDTAHRIRAVEAAHGPADHLDALDILGRQVGEVELAIGDVVGLDAVDQHQRVVPSAPRMRTCVKLPTPPLRLTATPGVLRSASATVRTCCWRNSSPVITVTAEPTCSTGTPPPPVVAPSAPAGAAFAAADVAGGADARCGGGASSVAPCTVMAGSAVGC